MKVAISGSTGFIGSSLKKEFHKREWDIISLTRSDFLLDDPSFAQRISGCHAVINLAGAPIFKRWTKSYKKTIIASRISSTQKIVNAIHSLADKPELFISASATGIYSEHGIQDEENFTYSSDFLAEVCTAWEAEARRTSDMCRTVLFRLGVVLDRNQGALRGMLPIFRLGLGGPVGNGRQGFPWIHIEDLVSGVFFLIENKNISGTVNMVAPEYVDNKGFSKVLAKTIHRPAFLMVPPIVLAIIYGKSSIILTKGQKINPKKLLNAGFVFHYPDIKSALAKIFPLK